MLLGVYLQGRATQRPAFSPSIPPWARETEAQALETICRTIRDFAERAPPPKSWTGPGALKANVLMGLESTQSRMSALGRGTLLQDRPLTTDEVIGPYNAVTAEDDAGAGPGAV